MQRVLIIVFACALSGVLAGATSSPAAAQEAAAGDTAAAQADGPYRSPLRAMCEPELYKDADWRADVKQKLEPEIHEEDARKMLVNRRHVVMAYAALWVIVLGFVVFMWIRQRRLQAEIARLERDIAQATKDD